jgi:hypothetical protein
LLLLALILLVGTGLRLREIADPLQQDELGPLYAVVEREGTVPGYTATADMPLRPVRSWAEVRERSILPYGIRSPFPLYHYLLYALVHVLPINEITLRLPSLLAGLGIIVTMFWLARNMAGDDAGLAAALLTAVEPMQIASSVMARPYALAVLAGMVSYFALWTILTRRRLWLNALAALVYALCITGIGYLNPILLLIGLPQAAFVLFWIGTSLWKHEEYRQVALALLWIMAGCSFAAGLLLPQAEYVREVRAFNSANREFLNWYLAPLGIFLYLHNIVLAATFIASILVGGIASWLFGKRNAAGDVDAQNEPSHFNSLVCLGLFLLILPQAILVIVDGEANRSMFMSRYLLYTQLGGILLFAGVLPQIKVPIVRWSILLPATIVMTALGSSSFGRGIQLGTPCATINAIQAFLKLEEKSLIRSSDVIIVRSGFLESDLPPGKFSDDVLTHLRSANCAPLITLYPTQHRRGCVVLPLSCRYGTSFTGNPLWKDQLQQNGSVTSVKEDHLRFWCIDWAGGRNGFPQCFLPRLANLLNSDLRVAADPASGRFDFEIPRDIKPGDRIPGLHGPSAVKFGPLILVERKPA